MRIMRLAVAVVVTAALAGAVAAQEAADTRAADLAAMQERAYADPDLNSAFRTVERIVKDGHAPTDAGEMMAFVLRQSGMQNLGFDDGLRIETVESLGPARERAQAAMQILEADLNGDWQITRDEVVEASRFGRIEMAAQAFLISDENRDDVLDTAEMRAAVETMVSGRRNGRKGGRTLMPVFDFDADGYLTREEIDRGIAALQQ